MNLYLMATIQGIVEGLTEFLPVSSTGHLILVGSLIGFEGEKAKLFEILIQLGAILAIVILYFHRILDLFGLKKAPVETSGEPQTTSGHLSLIHIGLAMAPAVVMGLLLHKTIKTHLFSPKTVLLGLVIGGIFLIFSEKKQPPATVTSLDQLSHKQAFSIGLFQCLALWPGFSRAGATIAGGLLCGVNHKTSADFSFLVAVPMMCAASGLDLVKSYKLLSMDDLGYFVVGFVVSFLVAIIAVTFFMRFLERTKLTPFAYYRFAVAIAYAWFILR